MACHDSIRPMDLSWRNNDGDGSLLATTNNERIVRIRQKIVQSFALSDGRVGRVGEPLPIRNTNVLTYHYDLVTVPPPSGHWSPTASLTGSYLSVCKPSMFLINSGSRIMLGTRKCISASVFSRTGRWTHSASLSRQLLQLRWCYLLLQ